MRSRGLRFAIVVAAPLLVLSLALAKQLLRLVPWHPVRSTRTSVRSAHGRYLDFRDLLDAERARSRRSVGQELRDDALASLFRGRATPG